MQKLRSRYLIGSNSAEKKAALIARQRDQRLRPASNPRQMKNSQVPNHRQRKQYAGKSQNVSKAVVQALVSELEAFRIEKAEKDTSGNRNPVQVKIGIDDHYYSEAQQLGSMARPLAEFEAEFARIALKNHNPKQQAALAYAMEIARIVEPLQLEKRTFLNMDDPLPGFDAPARFNVHPTFAGALELLSRVLYENFNLIARNLENLTTVQAAEFAGALHIAHEVHRSANPTAPDLKSSRLLAGRLATWAASSFEMALLREERRRQAAAGLAHQNFHALSSKDA